MSVPTQGPRGGVIHDLGFRHYEGPRAGSRAIALALYVDTLRGAFGLGRTAKSKILPAILLFALVLPAVIMALIVGIDNRLTMPADYTEYVLATSALTSLFIAGAAPANVSRDLRFRVVALYFSRPLQRVEYVLAKYAALASALFLMMAIPLIVMYAGALLAKLSIGSQTPNFLRGLGGAAVTAVLVAGIAVTIAAMTPRRGVGVAAIIVSLIVLAGVSGTVTGVADENGAETTAAYGELISPYALAHGVQHSVFGGPSEATVPPPGATGGAIFVLVAVALVAACLALLMARYRKVSI
ncbi:ABC transporter permease [Sporichthya polymorpha]|uniref:ABC transporter permease n=1 Tax=Sporichthya polymorpha TaxID=35751 RepID=UPI000369EE5A|nr:ABC transporter permease [Sporichthya polymorpha]